ncbi:hypothetical protein AB0L70_26100 [Kribbella sp. NPDC051952]|uniref:hypothetical protein n=1 Tax=Kribbella sp. NPDC051952 TaxID=3154851 RepID=UPI0034422701
MTAGGWRSQGWAALAASVALVLGAVVAPAASAVPAKVNSPDPALTITNVTLGRTSVAVSGLNTVAVPVTVVGGYATTDANPIYLNVFLNRSGGSGPVRQMVAGLLTLDSGTVQSGTWKGFLYVPSTANGTFTVTGVMSGQIIDGSDGSMTTPTPFAGPNLAVTGLHLPKIGVSIIPKVVPFGSAYTARVAITDSATGKAYGSRINVQITWDNLCVEHDGDRYLTNTSGIVDRAYPAAAGDALNCVRLRGRSFDTAGLGWSVSRPGIVSAAPSKTSARVGTIVPVNGTVAGIASGCPVILQRLYGATAWRAVSQDVVRQSGRFTVLAQPPYAGNLIYRVYFPRCGRYQAGYSTSFVIRGI